MEDLQIYDDLIQIDVAKYKERIDDLELHINKLNEDIQALCTKLLEMRETQKSLITNISALYKTAKSEIERKDRMIAQLRKEKDEILFRKGAYKRPRSPSKELECKRSRFSENVAEVKVEDIEGPKFSEELKDLEANSVKIDVKSSAGRCKDEELKKKTQENCKGSRMIVDKDKVRGSQKKSGDKERLKSAEKVYHKDLRKSPKSSERSKDKERSKSKEENVKKPSSKSPKTSRSSSSHSKRHYRKEDDKTTSSTSSNNCKSKSSGDLRRLLQSKRAHSGSSKERSMSSDKDCLKLKEDDKVLVRETKELQKSQSVGQEEMMRLAKDLEEGEILDVSIATKASEELERILDEPNTNDGISVKLDSCELQTTKNETETKPEFFLTDLIKEDNTNFVETKINEDNVVELHILPKTCVPELTSETGADLLLSEVLGESSVKLLSEVEGDSSVKMLSEVLGESSVKLLSEVVGDSSVKMLSEVEGIKTAVVETESEGCSITGVVRDQLNNENVNTINKLDVAKTEEKITTVSANTSLNTSNGRRRRRTAFVSIS